VENSHTREKGEGDEGFGSVVEVREVRKEGRVNDVFHKSEPSLFFLLLLLAIIANRKMIRNLSDTNVISIECLEVKE
jgi:hypothetical protein